MLQTLAREAPAGLLLCQFDVTVDHVHDCCRYIPSTESQNGGTAVSTIEGRREEAELDYLTIAEDTSGFMRTECPALFIM